MLGHPCFRKKTCIIKLERLVGCVGQSPPSPTRHKDKGVLGQFGGFCVHKLAGLCAVTGQLFVQYRWWNAERAGSLEVSPGVCYAVLGQILCFSARPG